MRLTEWNLELASIPTTRLIPDGLRPEGQDKKIASAPCRDAPAERRKTMNNEKSVTQSDSSVPEPPLSYDEIAARMRD